MNNPHLLLSSLVNQDQSEFGLPLLEDMNLVSVVHAWPKIHVVWNPPPSIEVVPLTDYELWETLWDFCSWDEEELAIAAGVTVETALRCFQRALIVRLIYPDGTISNSAKKIIALIMGSKLGKMAKSAANIKSSKPREDEAPKGEV